MSGRPGERGEGKASGAEGRKMAAKSGWENGLWMAVEVLNMDCGRSEWVRSNTRETSRRT